MKTTVKLAVDNPGAEEFMAAHFAGHSIYFDLYGIVHSGCRVESYDRVFDYDNEYFVFTINIPFDKESFTKQYFEEKGKTAKRIFKGTTTWRFSGSEPNNCAKEIITMNAEEMEKRIGGFMKTAVTFERRVGKRELYGPYNHYEGIDMKEWQFKSIHPADIDFEEIGASLTRQNPIALVNGQVYEHIVRSRPKLDKCGKPIFVKVKKVEEGEGADQVSHERVLVMESYTARENTGAEGYVVVHSSIYGKSLVATLPPPDAPHVDILSGDHHVFRVDITDFPKWVKWAKDVKGASWDDEDRRRALFTVSLPKV